jgi:ferredoxin-NADP reductase
LYSARARADLIYPAELEGDGTIITLTRERPQGWDGRTGRIDCELLAEAGWPPATRPLVYVCGPTGFVEGVADALVALGHEPSRIRTERFGPT